jgi:hypothetical protein
LRSDILTQHSRLVKESAPSGPPTTYSARAGIDRGECVKGGFVGVAERVKVALRGSDAAVA